MDPHVIPGFELLKPLRESSTSITWKAMQHSLSRTVAIKIPLPSLAENAEELDTLLTVARAVARLKHHNLVQVYDVVQAKSAPFLVMEFVDGPSLADLLARDGSLSQKQTVTIATAVASALDLAWRQTGLVHRNIKPSEIRIDADGTPKIADIGYAIIVTPEGAVTQADNAVVGTPHYLSPEQARGSRKLDCRTDMYALGATLYHAVTGRLPFEDTPEPDRVLHRQIQDQLPHPRQLQPSLSPALCAFISRLMMKSPEDRYSDWSGVLADLQRISTRKPLQRLPHRPTGPSTIAPLPSNAVSVRQAREPGTRRAYDNTSHTPFLLWLLLGVWLFWLARHRWDAVDSQGLSDEPPVADEQVETRPIAAGPPAEPSGTRPDYARPSTATRSHATATLPESMLEELATALRAEDRVTARRILAQAPAQYNIGAMRTALEAIPNPNVQVENGIMAQQGNTITITHLGQRRRLVPLLSINGEIQADMVDTGGATRRISFRVEQLSPEERLRWFPAPATPGEYASRAILQLAAGNLDAVAAAAPRCGPLEPIFAHAAYSGE